jgi:Ca2+/Na+ antiporter
LLNVFLVLGTVAYLNPVRVGERMHVVDAVGLAVITLLGVAVMRGRRQITRTEGGVLVAAYVGFLVAASAL